MKELCEGKLVFSFPDHLTATIYDRWAFRTPFESAFKDSHKASSCNKGTKAVDFIILDNETMWLIEVKDYRNPQDDEKLLKISDLSCVIALKIRDTLAGLVVAKNNAHNDEKIFATKALRSKRIRLVLHLEQAKKHPKAIDPIDIKQKLKQLLKSIDAHPLVVDQNTLHSAMQWSVRSKCAQDQDLCNKEKAPIFVNFNDYSLNHK